jgi:hypothetical protein
VVATRRRMTTARMTTTRRSLMATTVGVRMMGP